MTEPKHDNPLPAPVSESAPSAPGDQEPTWAKLWIETREKPWTTLAIIPGMPGYDVRPAASALVDVGRAAMKGDLALETGEGLTMDQSHTLLERLESAKKAGTPTVVSLDSPLANRAALLVSREADASLLVVPLEECSLSRARETVSEVGRERFLGTLVVRPK